MTSETTAPREAPYTLVVVLFRSRTSAPYALDSVRVARCDLDAQSARTGAAGSARCRPAIVDLSHEGLLTLSQARRLALRLALGLLFTPAERQEHAHHEEVA